MPQYRVLSLKPHLRLDWRGQDSQDETQKPDHSASLSDSATSSTRMRFSVHTAAVRQFSIADIILSWPRLTWPALAWRHAGPWRRKISATSSLGRSNSAVRQAGG